MLIGKVGPMVPPYHLHLVNQTDCHCLLTISAVLILILMKVIYGATYFSIRILDFEIRLQLLAYVTNTKRSENVV